MKHKRKCYYEYTQSSIHGAKSQKVLLCSGQLYCLCDLPAWLMNVVCGKLGACCVSLSMNL